MLGEFIFSFCICAVLAKYKPMENPDLFEGDMMLTREQKYRYQHGYIDPNIPLSAIRDNLWPRSIPYEIDWTLQKEQKAMKAIQDAMNDYHKFTCLRFKKRTTETHGYIHFFKGGGCWSWVGMVGRNDRPNYNKISLGEGCWSKGTAIHEIAHALGFYHEQSRPDRDNHVIIRWENIMKDAESQFEKQTSDTVDSLNVPYDLESIMHYGQKYFSKNDQITIQTRDPRKQHLISFRRNDFSKLDIKQMNLLYKCSGPQPPPPSDCEDNVNDCSQNKHHCNSADRAWRDYMNKACKRTCGSCGPSSSPSSNCKDDVNDCIQNTSYCNSANSAWRDYMNSVCRRTCGFCASG